ncbi:FAS1 domain-containing protein [Basidiobolus meristosporus CBS 931.73]|uniref:FAS1 domain-containing protein n=1 Tax=Basidiobolus meristosporus CBS 931.73 TaxID=1314790 RepID=A0A1Y1YG46_9FUNG|nr:FAS1 domain-containing protein [Basidiobolus meristosporus CBS 931.73]|eukprot:ORX96982.1 FAS1 domain-containing protein [Basidiobolus meristosporus CBS 931.73]
MAQFLDYSSDEDDFTINGPRGGNRRSKTVLDILANDRRFSRLVTGLSNNRQLKSDLTDPRAEFTIFAPTDDAFNKLKKDLKHEPSDDELRDILQYHIVPDFVKSRDIKKKGFALIKTSLELRSLNRHPQRIYLSEESDGKILINNKVQVSEADIEASNGLIHAIEEVLLPPKKLNDQINQYSNQFSIALKAFKDTGLLDKIKDEEGITIFLPTDAAFRNLGCGATSYLFSDKGKDDLKKILQLHISKKLAYSTSIIGDSRNRREREHNEPFENRVQLPTALKNEDIEIDVVGLKRHIDISINHQARLLLSDGLASNGVFHAIDNVLIPRDVSLPKLTWSNINEDCKI